MHANWLLVAAAGAMLAACGDTQEDRAASGGLGGAAMGALIGGPVGLLIGGGIGYATGNKLDKSADEKIEEMASVPPPDAPPRPRPVASEASGAAERPKVLTREQVEEKLNAAGYKPVRDIRRDGAAYLARGERAGTVYAVRVDAATGRLLASQELGTVPRDADDAPVMTEQQVRSTLRQTGYEMVGDVVRTGERYRAEAMQDGRLYDLIVDGRTGKVVRITPSSAGAPPRQGG